MIGTPEKLPPFHLVREAAEKQQADSISGYDPTQYQNPHPLDVAANAATNATTLEGQGQGQGLLEQSGPAEEKQASQQTIEEKEVLEQNQKVGANRQKAHQKLTAEKKEEKEKKEKEKRKKEMKKKQKIDYSVNKQKIYPRWSDLSASMQDQLLEKTVDAFLNMGLPIGHSVRAAHTHSTREPPKPTNQPARTNRDQNVQL